MRDSSHKKKINLRKRIRATFSAVLFFSFLLTWVIFNFTIMLFATEDNAHLAEQAVTGQASFILFVLIGMMFFVSVIASHFLSNSITRPIEKLGNFAVGIGKGNFDTNDFEFKDIELENLNAALNKSVEQLEAYDSEQKDFFQNASHELRTPLMSIKCYAEGIVYDVMEPKKASETILQETDKLSELVTDLLYIAKIDNISTIYTAEKSDLVEIIKACAVRQQAVANKKQIRFAFHFDENSITYECVAELISRAIDNLISNAIRHAASEITLSCYKNEDNIQICVIDDGSGIESETLPHVFERFYKGKGGNTGIGLSIVKSIVDQHKGHVRAENSNDGGAVFTITLPI